MLSVAFGLGGDICFSGSSDSTIRVWQMPGEMGDDPFTVYGMLCSDKGVHYLEQILSNHLCWCGLARVEGFRVCQIPKEVGTFTCGVAVCLFRMSNAKSPCWYGFAKRCQSVANAWGSEGDLFTVLWYVEQQ